MRFVGCNRIQKKENSFLLLEKVAIFSIFCIQSTLNFVTAQELAASAHLLQDRGLQSPPPKFSSLFFKGRWKYPHGFLGNANLYLALRFSSPAPGCVTHTLWLWYLFSFLTQYVVLKSMQNNMGAWVFTLSFRDYMTYLREEVSVFISTFCNIQWHAL